MNGDDFAILRFNRFINIYVCVCHVSFDMIVFPFTIEEHIPVCLWCRIRYICCAHTILWPFCKRDAASEHKIEADDLIARLIMSESYRVALGLWIQRKRHEALNAKWDESFYWISLLTRILNFATPACHAFDEK